MISHVRTILAVPLLLCAAGLVGSGQGGQGATFFETGQAADLLLSGYDFNRTGGPLRFNHPGGIAVVSGRLALADRNNNRVLLWAGVPESGEVPPSLVLGQATFDTNSPGTGLDALNWPTAVATDGTRLYVADTYNDRILVWRSAPTRSKQAADFAITAQSGIRWPWGIWTDGGRLAVSATFGGSVLVWNRIPEGDVPPDRVIRIAEFGTPRTIEASGAGFLVSDHNARVNGSAGNFFWRAFPAADSQPYDFFMASPPRAETPSTPVNPGAQPGEHIHDAETLTDGRFLALFNRTLCIWSAFPRDATDLCAVVVGASRPEAGGTFSMDAGDNSGMTVHEGRLLLSLNNGNRVVVFNHVPETSGQLPDFAIGSPDIFTNTLATGAIITNGAPVSDGRRLWVVSDYDRTLSIWRELPTRSGQPPDITQTLEFGPWAAARVGPGLALAGSGGTVAIWRRPPDGEPPDVVLRGSIGGVALGDLRGVASDDKFFYLASYDRNRVWVWRGVPSASDRPDVEIDVTQPGRISSDGRYLAVSRGGPGGGVLLFDVARLTTSSPSSVAIGQGIGMNLPQGATLADGALFVADTNSNRVLGWSDAADAWAGRRPDLVLGATDLQPRPPAIGRETLFWPGSVAFDGAHLWVAEFKFSNRILRFSRAR